MGGTAEGAEFVCSTTLTIVAIDLCGLGGLTPAGSAPIGGMADKPAFVGGRLKLKAVPAPAGAAAAASG